MSVLRRISAVVGCAVLALFSPLGCLCSAAATEWADCASPAASARYIVLFDDNTPENDASDEVSSACGDLTGYYPEIAVGVARSADPVFAERLGPGRAFSAQAQRLAERRAQPAGTVRDTPARARVDRTDPADVPGEDRTAEQWDMRMIRADEAREVERGSRDVVVGVLDSGIDAEHPDLAEAVDPALSAGCLSGMPDPSAKASLPTTSPHGTHVAGTIAAADDGAGTTGVAPGVRLASVKVIDDRGTATPEAVVCGLMWSARQGFEVTNSSFAVDPWGLSCARTDQRTVVRQAIGRAVEYAKSNGTLNVAAATNEGVNLSPSLRGADNTNACEALPAGLRDVVAVSSVGERGTKAGYSSYGLGVVNLTAPGGDDGVCVLSTVPGGYDSLCGTSMAAPHVSGVAALLASTHPEYSLRELRDALESQADATACPTDYDLTGDGRQDAFCTGYAAYNGFYGHGMVDALAAVSVPLAPEATTATG